MRKTIGPQVLVKMNDRFAVTIGGKPVTFTFQSTTQSLIVVNFAIEDHPYGPLFADQRLLGASQIDDAEPTKPEADPQSIAIGITAVVTGPSLSIIGTAMAECIGHAGQQFAADRIPFLSPNRASDPAHSIFFQFHLSMSVNCEPGYKQPTPKPKEDQSTSIVNICS